jgi:hypothetical protein
LLGMSVLSMWNNPVATEWIFIKFDNWVFFKILLRKLKFHYNLTRIIGTLHADYLHDDYYTYMVCSKSIGPLVGKNTIYLDVWNPNSLQSRLLGNAHTSSGGPVIAENISGKLCVDSCPAWLSRSA